VIDMKHHAIALAAAALGYLVFGSDFAARAQQTTAWASKPERLPAYPRSQRHHVKVSELNARHARQQDWRELRASSATVRWSIHDARDFD
jgi:hypothetical protein